MDIPTFIFATYPSRRSEQEWRELSDTLTGNPHSNGSSVWKPGEVKRMTRSDLAQHAGRLLRSYPAFGGILTLLTNESMMWLIRQSINNVSPMPQALDDVFFGLSNHLMRGGKPFVGTCKDDILRLTLWRGIYSMQMTKAGLQLLHDNLLDGGKDLLVRPRNNKSCHPRDCGCDGCIKYRALKALTGQMTNLLKLNLTEEVAERKQ